MVSIKYTYTYALTCDNCMYSCSLTSSRTIFYWIFFLENRVVSGNGYAYLETVVDRKLFFKWMKNKYLFAIPVYRSIFLNSCHKENYRESYIILMISTVRNYANGHDLNCYATIQKIGHSESRFLFFNRKQCTLPNQMKVGTKIHTQIKDL